MNFNEYFLSPWWSLTLPFVPLVWVVLLRFDRQRKARLAAQVGPRADELVANFEPKRRRDRRRLTVVGLLMSSLALMQPTWGNDDGSGASIGTDVFLVIDVSRSMLARDAVPSRLEKALEDARSFIESSKTDRIGLVAFAGEARLIAPLTQDRRSLLALVDSIDLTSVTKGGTNLGEAISVARRSFFEDSTRFRCAVFMSDGEKQDRLGQEEKAWPSFDNLVVHAVGYGTRTGAKIPVTTERGEAFLQDESGAEVVTKLEDASLRSLATRGRGAYLDARGRPSVLQDLYEAFIQKEARVQANREGKGERKNQFQWPLFLAFVFFTLELSWGDRRLS